ncbi:MAG TPA: hypothetical protein VGK34_06490 [Armatimonadota bacterium]
MTEESTTRSFPYKPPWYYIALFAVTAFVCLASGGMFVGFAWITMRTYRVLHNAPPQLYHNMTALITMGAVYLLEALYLGFWALHECLARERASICIEEDGLIITDWRNRQRKLSWPQIDKVAITLPGKLTSSPAIFHAAGSRYPVNNYTEKKAELIDEIIERAGLELVSDKWYRATYARR